MNYVFTRPDTWRELTDEEHSVLFHDEEGLEDAQERHGYYQINYTNFVNTLGGLEIWFPKRDRTPPWAYVVFMDMPGGAIMMVCIPTVPDFMTFLRLYGLIGPAYIGKETLDQLLTGLERLFYVLHHHPLSQPCWDCDPNGMEERKRWREEWKQRKTTEAW